MLAKIYSVLMNKGGVGKTSLITNLAALLATKYPNKKVLIIDCDGQGNASMSFDSLPSEFGANVADVFIGESTFNDVKIKITENLDIVPANDDMNYLEVDVLTKPDKFPSPSTLLKSAMEEIKSQYDYIFIDTPPALGLVAVNVLNVVDRVVIPFVPELYAVKGLKRVIEAIQEVKQEGRGEALQLAGIVGMMVDNRTRLHVDMLQEARKYCDSHGYYLFKTIIPRSIKFANSVALEGKPAVWSSERNHPIVAAYYELLEELLEIG